MMKRDREIEKNVKEILSGYKYAKAELSCLQEMPASETETGVLKEQIDKLAATLRKCTRIVSKLPCSGERMVLVYRYLLSYKWEDICDAMEYTDVSSVFKLHSKAITHLAAVFSAEKHTNSI